LLAKPLEIEAKHTMMTNNVGNRRGGANRAETYRLVTECPSGMDVADVLNFVEAIAAGGAFVRLVVSIFDARSREA
jgi:hypothetical protein